MESERELLGFKEAVLVSFTFLGGYGFKVVQKESTFVRYESQNAFVNIYHGRSSYEIGVEVGRRDRSEKYGLAYMVSNAGKEAWEREGLDKHTMFQVNSREGVMEFVPKVADLVKKYGADFLQGDPLFYDEFEKVNKRRAVEFTKKQHLDAVRKNAEAAWSNKNFSKVEQLYQSIASEDLTAIEKKRLAIAQKNNEESR